MMCTVFAFNYPEYSERSKALAAEQGFVFVCSYRRDIDRIRYSKYTIHG